jgi:uncharacterized protein (DUF1499 family)
MRYLAHHLGILGALVLMIGCGATEIGLRPDGLAPCPGSPNCVSSQAEDEKHRIEPLAYPGSRQAAQEKIKALIAGMERTTIIADRADYMHVEFRSRWFKFVDDVEFWFPEDAALIHLRSASRVGYSDMGVNRKRVDRIRALFME